MTIDLTKPINIPDAWWTQLMTLGNGGVYAASCFGCKDIDRLEAEAYRMFFEAAPDMLRFILTMDDWLNSFDGDKDRLYMEALRHQFTVAGTLMKVGYSLGELLEIESKRTPHWVRRDFEKKDRLRAEYDRVMSLLRIVSDPEFETAHAEYARGLRSSAQALVAEIEQGNS